LVSSVHSMMAVLAGSLAAWSTGCFSPEFDRCAVACGAGQACPPGTVCLGDGMCHASAAGPLCTAAGRDGGPDATALEDGGGHIDAQVSDAGPPVTPTQAGQLVISEVMIDPVANPEEPREWFEVYNPSTSTSYDLFGIRVRGEQVNERFNIDTSLVIPPGGYLLFGRSGDTAINGGLEHDFVYGNALELGNTSGDIALVYPLGDVVIDLVSYSTMAAGWPRSQGHSISLDPDLHDASSNDLPASWCLGTVPYTDEPDLEHGTPGEPNPPCP
jgi:hypothetical protein